jgi:hypothetical protein
MAGLVILVIMPDWQPKASLRLYGGPPYSGLQMGDCAQNAR